MPIIADVTASSGPTLGQLVTEIVTTVQGYAVAPDQMVTLKAACDSNALTLMVEGAASPGVFEIGDELVFVTAVDDQSGTCTVHPRGRGWQGTTPSSHDVGAVVSVSPSFPRARVVAELNNTLNSLYPAVFGVGTATGTVDGPMLEVPGEAEAVLDVRTQDSNGDWQRVRHWEAENSSAVGTSGTTVRLPRSCVGDVVQVVYATRPAPLSGSEQQWSDTGLPVALKDVVVLGVMVRFMRLLDIGRLTDRFDTPKGDTQQPSIGIGVQMSRDLKADFKAALDAETAVLRNRYPARAHFVR